MARPLRLEFPGALYLVSARAVSRQKLFRNAEEVADFEARLPALVSSFGARFHGFCLLPNHYHLLVETPQGNLSRVLHRLNSGFTATVNARRRRSGPLLQSRYRSLLLDEDPWLLRLSVHVHLNPVRLKLTPDPWSFVGSSARAYAVGGVGIPGVETSRVLGLAGGREAYAALMAEALHRPPAAPWKEVWRQCVLGGQTLRDRVSDAVRERDAREIPGFSAREEGLDLQEIVALVAENTGVAPREILRGKFQRTLARKMAICLVRRHTGLTLRQIGDAFGVDYTTVHMVSRRMEELAADEEGVRELLRALEADLASRSSRPAARESPPAKAKKARAPAREKKVKQEPSQLKLF